MDYRIRQMTMADYPMIYALWEKTEGLNLEEADSQEAISIYLRRNRGLCFVACDGDRIIGTVLCGHDGRRGILRHLAVSKKCRCKGIARALINKCLSALAKQRVQKCNTHMFDTHVEGRRFWEHMGWHMLEDNYRTLQTLTVRQK